MYDIDEIRRRAMGLLEKEAGGPVAAAKRAGMKYAQWANLRSGALDSKTGKPRGMRKETARKIEVAFGKQDGWLDTADLIEHEYPHDDPGFALVTRAWDIADESSKSVPLAWANATLAAHGKK
jgi:hypothetical protein